MIFLKKNVLVLFGGVSSEHAVSCVSAANICSRIDTDRFELLRVGITRDGVWWLYTGPFERMKDESWEKDTENLTAAILSPCTVHHGLLLPRDGCRTVRVDVIFPVLHGKNGEDGRIQGLAALAGIPCVGCDTYSSAVCMNKAAAKLMAFSAGVESTPFLQFTAKERDLVSETVAASLEFPVFVKPVNGGSSIGISKVKAENELETAFDEALKYDDSVIIEQGVYGKEVEVAVMGREDPVASGCGEIVAGTEFYDYDNKYVDDTAKLFIPARLEPETAQAVRDAALRVYGALGCKGLARVDFFVTEENEVLFNEINTLPGFTPISMYAKLFEYEGISQEKLVNGLIDAELEK